MASRRAGDRDLQRQRAGVEAAFRGGWAPPGTGEPGVLLVPEFREARRVIRLGGPTWLAGETVRAVRDGAKPGDRLPPGRRNDRTGLVTDVEVIITGSGEGRRVAVLFSHRHFPGVRFGHRFEPDRSGGTGAALAFREDIETGALNPMMDLGAPTDSDGITWTPWSARVPGPERLEQQFAEIETAFRQGWRPVGAGGPRVLTERAYAEARKVLGRGGWTDLDPAAVEAVRAGARPGDRLPPLRPSPYIDGVTDTEVVFTGSSERRRVAVLFCHEHFPGARFGHRFPPDGDPVDLMEEIETGALHRMMGNPPPADSAGVIWTGWGEGAATD